MAWAHMRDYSEDWGNLISSVSEALPYFFKIGRLQVPLVRAREEVQVPQGRGDVEPGAAGEHLRHEELRPNVVGELLRIHGGLATRGYGQEKGCARHWVAWSGLLCD